MSTATDVKRLSFLEYARSALAKTGADVTFDELVAGPLTEIAIEALYGEETAINVGIARDPDDFEKDAEWFKQARPASEVAPELVEAYRRGEMRIAPGLGSEPVPPGATLREEIAARGMSQRKLARAMGRPVQAVNRIVLGRKALTPRTALELERVLGIPAHFWTRLEADYRLALERARGVGGTPVTPGSQETPIPPSVIPANAGIHPRQDPPL